MSDVRAAGRAALAQRWGLAPDSPLLRAALTHRSAVASLADASERLEFLGDALLGAFVARYLLERFPADVPEGTLSEARMAIIRQGSLAAAGRALGLADLLEVGENERREARHTQDKLLADAYEALLGALALEAGDGAVAAFLTGTLGDALEAVVASPPGRDPKNQLQERLQARRLSTPTYALIEHETDGRRHRFVVAVQVDGQTRATGEGPNRQSAERIAAQRALDALEADKPGE